MWACRLVRGADLVKYLHSSVDHLQLEELLGEVFHPEVDGTGVQAVEEEECQDEHGHTQDIRQLLALQSPLLCCRVKGVQTMQSSAKSDGQDCKNCLRRTFFWKIALK